VIKSVHLQIQKEAYVDSLPQSRKISFNKSGNIGNAVTCCNELWRSIGWQYTNHIIIGLSTQYTLWPQLFLQIVLLLFQNCTLYQARYECYNT